MEILKNFGFEPILFIAQIVNFLVIFFVMKKFLYAPIQKTLEDRKRKIDEGLRSAEESTRLMQETIDKEAEILKKAHEEATKLIADAKSKHDAILQQTHETTRLRVEKMLEDARNQINLETVQAEKRLSAHVSKIAVQFLQQGLRGFFGSQEQEAIMKIALKKLKKKAD